MNSGVVLTTSVQKIAAITDFFAAVGPPLGSLVLWCGVGLFGSGYAIFTGQLFERPFDLMAALLVAIGAGIFGMPLGYIYGIVPAGLAGLIIGILHVHHRSNYFSVLAVGACVGSGYALALRNYFPNLVQPNQSQPLWVLVLICMLTTVLCWRGVRNWYQEDLRLDGGHA